MTSEIVYEGNLRTTATHLRSGTNIITDAPVDNKGKGEAFSPTDLVATALASCMITIMGIKADQHEIDITQTKASVLKVMQSDPRRIAAVEMKIEMPANHFSEKHQQILERAALTCPVALSLAKEIEIKVDFVYL